MSDITEFNVQTGQSIFRTYTPEEQANFEIAKQHSEETMAREAPIFEAFKAQQAALVSAHAKLAALGLTVDEISAIAGVPLPIE